MLENVVKMEVDGFFGYSICPSGGGCDDVGLSLSVLSDCDKDKAATPIPYYSTAYLTYHAPHTRP